jgi:hypothetical protein
VTAERLASESGIICGSRGPGLRISIHAYNGGDVDRLVKVLGRLQPRAEPPYRSRNSLASASSRSSSRATRTRSWLVEARRRAGHQRLGACVRLMVHGLTVVRAVRDAGAAGRWPRTWRRSVSGRTLTHVARDKASLDIFWVRDETLEDVETRKEEAMLTRENLGSRTSREVDQ